MEIQMILKFGQKAQKTNQYLTITETFTHGVVRPGNFDSELLCYFGVGTFTNALQSMLPYQIMLPWWI